VQLLADTPRRTLTIRDFDFESKPLWFWYEKPTAVLTSLSYMDIGPFGDPLHDSLQTEVAPLQTPDAYAEWIEHITALLTSPDILTGHNIDRFDLPLLQAQRLRFGMSPLPALQTQDTMRLPKRRDMSVSQESLISYAGLKPTCSIGMPIYKNHLAIPAWEEAALGWNDATLIERPASDVHGHAHLRQVLVAKEYLGAPRRWRPAR